MDSEEGPSAVGTVRKFVEEEAAGQQRTERLSTAEHRVYGNGENKDLRAVCLNGKVNEGKE